MKKTVSILVIIMLIATAAISFAGCRESFGAKNVREQIENNLGWHRDGEEVCVYDVLDGENVVGSYESRMKSTFKETVTIVPSVEDQKRSLENFSGYKFISDMTAEENGVKYKRYTESYSDLGLNPILSYVKEENGDSVVEIICSYEDKKINAVYISGGEIVESSIKYAAGSLTYDNAFIYQFARATDLSTTLSITVPTFENAKIKKSSFTMGYMAGATVTLQQNLTIKKEFSFKDGDEESAANKGAFDSEDQIKTETDEEGKVTTTYPYTDSALIPSSKCTFVSNNSSLVRGSISCYISTYPVKLAGGERFAARAVTMMQEGNKIYRLKSISYSSAYND